MRQAGEAIQEEATWRRRPFPYPSNIPKRQMNARNKAKAA